MTDGATRRWDGMTPEEREAYVNQDVVKAGCELGENPLLIPYESSNLNRICFTFGVLRTLPFQCDNESDNTFALMPPILTPRFQRASRILPPSGIQRG